MGVLCYLTYHDPAPGRSCRSLRSLLGGVTHHDVLPHRGHGGEGGGLGPDHDPGGGGRGGLSGEEGGALVLGEGVGVEVVGGAGEAGHGVARGGAQAALSQVEPGGGE